MANVVMNS